ncbi:hypothetical protein [Sphaerisporangium perillae]|uniref:hypothetical protein n=1 Tax=Sphaerisporangium perillae TaxID=2935860 RepID=UPI00200CA899|nr:hypothetical protein [Sphaerisporangium perillae]
MSYEGWEYGYVTGLLGAIAYCVVNPVRGRMIGLSIAGASSKPSSLTGAGDKWDETSQGIGEIGAQLKKHMDDVPLEDWTAADVEALRSSVQLVLSNLNEGSGVHADAAKIMHGLGKLSFYGALLSGTAGVVLTALTIYTLATRGIPGVNVATQASSELVATGTQLSVKGMVMKYGAVAAGAMMVFSLVTGKQSELEAQIAAMKTQGDAVKQVRIPLSNNSPGSNLTLDGSTGANPYGTGTDPYGTGTNSYGTGTDPYGTGQVPAAT